MDSAALLAAAPLPMITYRFKSAPPWWKSFSLLNYLLPSLGQTLLQSLDRQGPDQGGLAGHFGMPSAVLGREKGGKFIRPIKLDRPTPVLYDGTRF
jgi:hypothetical protein